MEKKIITFTADEQSLRKTGGIPNYASNKVSYIEAQFELGENWQGFDAVRAIWYNKAQTISMVLADGKCIVPYEVLANKGQVMVNLVGSISENDVLTDRLTTYPVVALIVDADAKVDGSNTYPITPSQFEQFVEAVKADAKSASESAESASASAESASASAKSAHDDKIEIEQKIAEAIQQIEDFEQVQVVVNTLPPTSPATSDFTDGVLTLGIPRGKKGDTGNGIQSIAKISTSGLVDTYRITYTDGQATTFTVTNGKKGDTGNGIASIEKTSTVGLVDTYTITYTDGNTSTFTVTNGEKGDTGEVSQAEFDEAVSDLKSEINDLSEGKIEVAGTAIPHVVIFAQGSDGIGNIAYYNNNNVVVFPLENGKRYYINTTRLSSGYVALSNYLFEGSTVTYNKKITADENGDINFVNSDNHKYAYIYTKVESNYFDAVCRTETEMQEDVQALKASTSYTDMILPKLRGISGTFENQTVTPISGKYIFGEPNSNLNGSIQNSYAQVNYATFNVEEGDVFEISTCATASVPFATFFNSSTPSSSSYVSTVEFVNEAKEYIKRIVIIPQGVRLLGVNTNNINSCPIIVRKYVIDDYLHCFYELDLNSFSKNPLDRMSNAISAFDKIICLGDSVVEGGENPPPITPDPANAKRTVTDAEYSFPTYLTKMYGVETVNCGHSGYSSVDLYNHYKNSDLAGYDGAIIEVGTNDSNISQDADTAIQESKTAMLALIAKLRADNPGIRIFLCTTLPGWASGTVGDGVRANIADIVSNTVGVYLVDFYNFTKCKADSAYRNNHPTAIGYRQLAQELSSACDYYMELYPNQFKWLRTIGTQNAVIDY